jgi:hypothetical protein
MSMAKFVRDPAGLDTKAKGKVGFSTGLLVYGYQDTDNENDDDFHSEFGFFPVEAALSVWVADIYDLTLSAHTGMLLGLEGNLALVNEKTFRLGIVHGIGLGFRGNVSGYEDDWEGNFFADFSGGLVLQFSAGSGAAFVGAKYTYGLHEPLGGDPDSEDPESGTHYVTSSLGYMFVAGGLRITPEFVLSYGDWNYEYTDALGSRREADQDIWIFLPTISIAADY